MKIFVVAVIFCSTYHAFSSNFCVKNCRDLANPIFCKLMSLRRSCGSKMSQMLCPLSCKLCKNCGQNRALDDSREFEPVTCEVETCVDLAPPNQCIMIKNYIRNGCDIYPESCRQTCGQCKPCAIPSWNCSTDCEDHDDSCSAWKLRGYCKQSSKFYGYTSSKCPKSCSACISCPIPSSMNTALPPVPPNCSNNCFDIHRQCGNWKAKGYCQKSKKYPYLLKVCESTCGACFPCPTKAPTTTNPSCSKDCEDASEDCQSLKIDGHCDRKNKFSSFVYKACPESCGICTACSKKKDILATLLPTNEKMKKKGKK